MLDVLVCGVTALDGGDAWEAAVGGELHSGASPHTLPGFIHLLSVPAECSEDLSPVSPGEAFLFERPLPGVLGLVLLECTVSCCPPSLGDARFLTVPEVPGVFGVFFLERALFLFAEQLGVVSEVNMAAEAETGEAPGVFDVVFPKSFLLFSHEAGESSGAECGAATAAAGVPGVLGVVFLERALLFAERAWVASGAGDTLGAGDTTAAAEAGVRGVFELVFLLISLPSLGAGTGDE